jgi:SAM-dependent methyltransferase
VKGNAVDDKDYRAAIGPRDRYDIISAMTFGLLTSLGLRDTHRLLDIGCGSLRNGRLLIPYLNPGHYVGIEPARWLVEYGIRHETGHDLIEVKRPLFIYGGSGALLDQQEIEPFDFAVAQSVFSHCYPDLLEDWITHTAGHLQKDGALVATFFIGTTDAQGKGWTHGKATYRESTLRKLAASVGLSFDLIDWQHPGQKWALLATAGFDKSWFADKPICWNTLLQRLFPQ